MTKTELTIDDLKLGRLAPKEGAVKVQLGDFLNLAVLPPLPPTYGHKALFPTPSQIEMYLNDQLGDCTIASLLHQTLLYELSTGVSWADATASLSDDIALKLYEAIAGYKPGDPSTDNGAVISDVAKYRVQTGFTDLKGKTHKLAGFAGIDVSNRELLGQAVHLELLADLGVQVQGDQQQQFMDGKPWSWVKGGTVEGGHCVPLVDFDGEFFYVATWGQIWPVVPSYFDQGLEEAFAYFTDDMLENGKSVDGFDATALQGYLAAL